MGCYAAEEPTGRCSHDRVHEEQTGEEHGHSADSFGDSTEIGCNEKECELAWSFRA
jgi:hypothetical protein